MLKSVLVQSCAYMWIILAVIVERRHPTYAIHFNIKASIHFCDRFRTFLVFQAPSCSLFLSLDLSSLWSGSLHVLLFLRNKNSVPIIPHITRAGYNQLDARSTYKKASISSTSSLCVAAFLSTWCKCSVKTCPFFSCNVERCVYQTRTGQM